MAKQTDITADIAIIGGGAAGLTLAALLGDAGLTVCIVDPHPPAALKNTPPNGRTVALMEASLNILKATNIWDDLSQFCNPMEMMRIIDDSDPSSDAIEIEFPATDIALEQFGYNIPAQALRAILFERIYKHPQITFIKTTFAEYTTKKSAIKIRLENGRQITAQLLIGADGRNSSVRKAAGVTAKVKKYNQSAITCLINHSHAHNNTSTEFHRENGPMALVPLPGNQSSVVWVETHERAEALLKLKKQDFTQSLQDKTNNILGGITLEIGPEAWPLCSIKANHLTATRVALIAEAAHVMSPITAQGLNLSLRDVAALTETIIDAARVGMDVGSPTILSKYEKRRAFDIDSRVAGVNTMNQIVSTKTLALKQFRRAGLKSLDHLLPLKTIAMQIGLAPKVDQSRLARGENL